MITLQAAFGADSTTIQRQVTSFVQRGDQALATGQDGDAEDAYKAALNQCGLLADYHCTTDVLRKLGRSYDHFGRKLQAGAVYKQIVNILVARQVPGGRPDLAMGIALFDLQSLFSNAADTTRDADELAYMDQARTFYEQCMGFPDLRAVCDRRLADVEGLHGSLYTLKRRFDEAAPFLKAVIARPDAGVRQEVLVAALKAYATILIIEGRAAEAQPFLQRAQRLETAP